jgi:hypothetical protein
MPSPFPGMDPFIEGQVWLDFHTELITTIRALLAPKVIPRYVVRVEEHQPRYRHEAYLTVRDRETLTVVTFLELLSPTNKQTGSVGRTQYLDKRDELLQSEAHLVELDLLRGGDRLPTVELLPAGDYCAVLSRRQDRPRVAVYVWSLRQPLPTIPVPLAHEDPDVPLDLQSAFISAYDRAYYGYSLNYRLPIVPSLSEADADWVRQILETASSPD